MYSNPPTKRQFFEVGLKFETVLCKKIEDHSWTEAKNTLLNFSPIIPYFSSCYFTSFVTIRKTLTRSPNTSRKKKYAVTTKCSKHEINRTRIVIPNSLQKNGCISIDLISFPAALERLSPLAIC